MIICKLCNNEFDENKNTNECPNCSEKYLTITLTDYQKLAGLIQNQQCKIEQLYDQSWNAYMSDNKFKNHLRRESDIYGNISAWFDLVMKEFNIPKDNNLYPSTYYDSPSECQLNSRKVCNKCGDC